MKKTIDVIRNMSGSNVSSRVMTSFSIRVVPAWSVNGRERDRGIPVPPGG
jgi:hypothetical protein